MTDILNSLSNVVAKAEYGIDPHWLELAIKEIEQTRVKVLEFCDADLGIYVCCCDYLECVCEEASYNDAVKALHETAETWDAEGGSWWN
jgi:hypothetical protein